MFKKIKIFSFFLLLFFLIRLVLIFFFPAEHELKYEIENYVNTPDKPTRGNLRQKELRGIAHGSSTIVNPKDGLFSAETILGGDVDFEDTWFATSDSPIKHITKLDRLTELQYIDGLTRLKHEKVQKISTDEWLIGNYN